MSETRQLLLVGGTLLCLLVVASTLPAADPRLEVGSETPDELEGEPPAAPSPVPTPEDEDRVSGPAIEVTEPAQPTAWTNITLVGLKDSADVDILVDGEYIGETDSDGEIRTRAPAAREMTVTAVVPSQPDNLTRTVEIRTDTQLRVSGDRAPGQSVQLNATVGSMPLSNGAVFVDGQRVGQTLGDGKRYIDLPETAGPATLRVERSPFEGTRTIDVAEPELSLQSPLLFPGSFAVVTVTADGVAVDEAPVSVNGDQTATTDDDGEALIQLPLAGQARVTTALGAETATTTVGDLYLRLTAVVVLVPGLAIGSIWTAGRLLTAIERTELTATQSSHQRSVDGGVDPFVALANLLGAFADALDRLGRLCGQTLSLSWPGLSLPSMQGISVSWPAISLSSFGDFELSMPSLSVLGSNRWFGVDDSHRPDVALDTGGQIDDEAETAIGRRAQIRVAWHAFLDRLGVKNRATLTAGQVARRAVAEGFRAGSVWRLVAAFRDVEYGNRDPSPERLATVRAITETLLDDSDDEEGPQ